MCYVSPEIPSQLGLLLLQGLNTTASAKSRLCGQGIARLLLSFRYAAQISCTHFFYRQYLDLKPCMVQVIYRLLSRASKSFCDLENLIALNIKTPYLNYFFMSRQCTEYEKQQLTIMIQISNTQFYNLEKFVLQFVLVFTKLSLVSLIFFNCA